MPGLDPDRDVAACAVAARGRLRQYSHRLIGGDEEGVKGRINKIGRVGFLYEAEERRERRVLASRDGDNY